MAQQRIGQHTPTVDLKRTCNTLQGGNGGFGGCVRGCYGGHAVSVESLKVLQPHAILELELRISVDVRVSTLTNMIYCPLSVSRLRIRE